MLLIFLIKSSFKKNNILFVHGNAILGTVPQIAYNSSLRRFVFLPWRSSATEMFANLEIHSFDEMLIIFVFSF